MNKSLESRSRPTAANWKSLISTAAVFMAMTGNIFAAARFVNGLVPDWNQPYRYIPGGDPAPFVVNQWNDWCAPSSGANLAGHWADARGVPVADTTNFPNSTVAWAVGPSWHDYQADGTVNRPPFPPGLLPAQPTDIGWYMNANLGVGYDGGVALSMGGFPFVPVNLPHSGTYLKDIHAGLQNYLNCRYSFSGGVFWRTGTRGSAFAAGTAPSGLPAVVHPNGASAFAELRSEIDTNRTLILCFSHWNIVNKPINLGSSGTTNMESFYGGTYYTWGSTPGPSPTNAEDEVWNYQDNDTALGHAVTAVGYIPAGDADDKWQQAGLAGPTDWVIVHDNWSSTPRNVIIPFTSLGNWVATWVANTTALPWPTAAKFVKGAVPDWNQPYHYNGQSPNGGPGADPQAGVVNQWNDWCAPCSSANLAGHWTDYHGAPVADTTPFPGSTMAWAASSWQDYLADGTVNRPPFPPSPPPAQPTDIGWYMDVNLGIGLDAGGGFMGGFPMGNPVHAGTYLKDIHIGLQMYLNNRYTVGSAGWNTGTEGKGFAGGMNPTGGVAQIHLNPASAFGEVTFEINRDQTLILCYKHWNVNAAAAASLPTVNTNTESGFGGSFYQFGTGSGSSNAEDEEWNLGTNGVALGHAVTAVGYIPAGDVLDPSPSLQMPPTDWVIVHDNWFTTPRNVIVPFDYFNNWVANTIAYPDPGFLQLSNIVVVGRTNAVVSFTGIPGYLHDLLWKTNLLTTNAWSVAVSNVAFAAGTMQITNIVPTSDPQRFYRIKASN